MTPAEELRLAARMVRDGSPKENPEYGDEALVSALVGRADVSEWLDLESDATEASLAALSVARKIIISIRHEPSD